MKDDSTTNLYLYLQLFTSHWCTTHVKYNEIVIDFFVIELSVFFSRFILSRRRSLTSLPFYTATISALEFR